MLNYTYKNSLIYIFTFNKTTSKFSYLNQMNLKLNKKKKAKKKNFFQQHCLSTLSIFLFKLKILVLPVFLLILLTLLLSL